MAELALEPNPIPEQRPARRRRPVPASVRRRVFLRDGFVCVWCLARDDLTLDHIVPVSKGGGNHDTAASA